MLRNLRIKNFKGWKDTNNRQASKLDELGELFHFSKNQTMEMKIVRVLEIIELFGC